MKTRAWTDSSTYLSQRRLFAQVSGSFVSDSLLVEETVVDLLERVVRSAYYAPSTRSTTIDRRRRGTVRDIESILSRPADECPTLTGIAREVGLSAYHTCRLFHRVTGMKLHQYRVRLRLRAALAEVQGSTRSLTDIALDAGFSSHSHFTASFRKEFGVTPSALRASRFSRAIRASF